MNTIRFSCPNCTQHIEAPIEMASVQIDCPNCGKEIAIPESPNEALALLDRFQQLHDQKYKGQRAWDEDLATVFLLSPKTMRAWAAGASEPNKQRLEKLRLLITAMEKGQPLKMWAKGEHGRDLEMERIEQMRRSGIRWVEVLGCNDPKRECDACRAMKGRPFPIEEAVGLPLPGCDLLECLCITLASEGP